MIRLNLGAGNKVLMPPWVNVDFSFPKDHGLPPEIILKEADILDLSEYADNSVAEILCANTIEHIRREKVPGMLKEWFRILAPGAFVAVECPNLIKCCANVLQVLTDGNEDFIFDNGLLGLYGQSKEENDHMNHLWGYWPASLQKLLEEAGFINIAEELTVVKPWASKVRDMRMVGRKPKAKNE